MEAFRLLGASEYDGLEVYFCGLDVVLGNTV
jgi:hypothetical protein